MSFEKSVNRQNSAHGSEVASVSPPEDYNPLLDSGSFGSGSVDSYDLDNDDITDSDSLEFPAYGVTPPYDSRVARAKTRIGKREKLRYKEDSSSKNINHKNLTNEKYQENQRNHPRSAARQIIPANQQDGTNGVFPALHKARKINNQKSRQYDRKTKENFFTASPEQFSPTVTQSSLIRAMSHEFKSFNRLNSVEESPCSSPHSDGLSSDSLLKPDCAQHRKDFYSSLIKKINLGSSYHKQKESVDLSLSISDNTYEPTDRWREDYQNALWLEIRSRLADRDIDEFEKYLQKQRREYCNILDEIMQLNFNQKSHNNPIDSENNGDSTYNSINSLTDSYRDSSPNQSSSTLVDVSITTENDDKEDDMGFQIDDFSNPEDEQLEESSIDEVEKDYLAHWLNQEEKYTTTAWNFGDLSVMAIDKEYAERVISIMKRLDRLERLYPNLKSLARSEARFRNVKLQERINTLTLWLNMVQNLSRQFCLMSNELSVNIKCNDTFCNYQKVDLDPDERLRSCSIDITAFRGIDHNDTGNSSITESTNGSLLMSSQSFDSQLNQETAKIPDVTIILSNPESDDDVNEVCTHDGNHVNKEQQSESTLTDPQDDDNVDIPCYKVFVERCLKLMGVDGLVDRLKTLLKMTVDNARFALEKPNVFSGGDTNIDNRRHLIYEHGAWSSEFQEMGLPTFRRAVLTLLKIPLDVLHECLRIRLEHLPSSEPSSFSIEQLLRECKQVLLACFKVKNFYQESVEAILVDFDSVNKDIFDSDVAGFEEHLHDMQRVYFNYLHHWLSLWQTVSSNSMNNVLEEEWSFLREISSSILDGEVGAAKRFCALAAGMIKTTGDYLQAKLDEYCMEVEDNTAENVLTDGSRRKVNDISRYCRDLFNQAKQQANKALSFAKMLKKDLEIAATFKIQDEHDIIVQKLYETGHVQVVTRHTTGMLIFAPVGMVKNKKAISKLMNVCCSRDTPDSSNSDQDYYLLIITNSNETKPLTTIRRSESMVFVDSSIEAAIALSDIIVDHLTLLVENSAQLGQQRHKFQKLLKDSVTLVNKKTTCHQGVLDSLDILRNSIYSLSEEICSAIERVHSNLHEVVTHSYYVETMHACYNMGFEYHREIIRLLGWEEISVPLGPHLIDLALQWTAFVQKNCEKGRGSKPRWSLQGLEFLSVVCSPQNVAHISEDNFQLLKASTDKCVAHIIGNPIMDKYKKSKSSRIILPPKSPSSTVQKLQRPVSYPTSIADKLKGDVLQRLGSFSGSDSEHETIADFFSVNSPGPLPVSGFSHQTTSSSNSSGVYSLSHNNSEIDRYPRSIRVLYYIEKLEERREKKLFNDDVIGRLCNRHRDVASGLIDALIIRKVKYRWQRSKKIGEGRFGKVYTCISLDTGEIMAMKEIRFQRGDLASIREIADEIGNIENINHPNLVKCYGAEIHREQLLIFMEYCNEGTISDAAKNGLPEAMIRRYTKQILVAIDFLHENGIVHRDIKGNNIFLARNGLIKLGDFGCSVKLSKTTTMYGEFNNMRGTTAFMAPEMITENKRKGHGRAVDIWSLGCVVIEMVTGRHPWSEFDDEFAIMFQVGSGAAPVTPDSISDEGKDFLSRCLVHDPQDRWTTSELLNHPFVKVKD